MNMFDYMLTKEQLKIRDEVRDLVKWVPKQMILDMDADKIKFPKEFLREAGRRNLMGCRYPAVWGGRGMDHRGCHGRGGHIGIRNGLRLRSWGRAGL
jgi:alkylation response protein AidB-like acyl-CoA dehydrogenase